MASVSSADTWREAGARSARSAGGSSASRAGRPAPGERPARPPVPPLPPLPSHGRGGSPAQRPAAAAPRNPGQGRPVQGRPVQRPPVPPADRATPPRRPDESGRVIPGYPRSSASLSPAADRRRRQETDDAGRPDAASSPRTPRAAGRPAETTVPERGSRLRGSLAVLGVLVVTLAAGFLDATGNGTLGLITLVGLVGSTAVATLLVRRRDMTTLVIAPPLVYLAVVAVLKYTHRASGAGPKKVGAEVAAELALGQGFTVMAAATGTALVLALVRWAARR